MAISNLEKDDHGPKMNDPSIMPDRLLFNIASLNIRCVRTDLRERSSDSKFCCEASQSAVHLLRGPIFSKEC